MNSSARHSLQSMGAAARQRSRRVLNVWRGAGADRGRHVENGMAKLVRRRGPKQLGLVGKRHVEADHNGARFLRVMFADAENRRAFVVVDLVGQIPDDADISAVEFHAGRPPGQFGDLDPPG